MWYNVCVLFLILYVFCLSSNLQRIRLLYSWLWLSHYTIVKKIWMGINLGCIDVYVVLEWANDMKLHVFATKHKANTYHEHWPQWNLWRHANLNHWSKLLDKASFWIQWPNCEARIFIVKWYTKIDQNYCKSNRNV